MVLSSHFELETCAVLYESLLFMIIKIALPSNDTIAIIALVYSLQLKATPSILRIANKYL